MATITDARFGNHVAVDGDAVYVAADHRLLKYDANTFTLLDEADVPGIRRFDFWNDDAMHRRTGRLAELLRGARQDTLDGLRHRCNTTLPYSCEGVHVEGDKSYIAVNKRVRMGQCRGQARCAGCWPTQTGRHPWTSARTA